MKVRFDHAQEEAANIVTFFFKPESSFRYTAGQFVELTLPHDKPDSRGTRRWFTVSSSPAQSLLSITTRFDTIKGSSFKRALLLLESGQELHMSDPLGDFVLPKSTATPLIFVAAGIGITPYHSMLAWITDNNEARPIKLLYAVRNEDDIIFTDTFKRAKQHATIVVSDPSDAWGGERGHLTAELVVGIEEPAENALIYFSGPEPLVESLIETVLKKGINYSQIVRDTFPGYTII